MVSSSRHPTSDGRFSGTPKRNRGAPTPKPPSTARHLPGESGIWFFIMGDMLLFGLFFCVFVFYRGQDVDTFQQSRLLLNQSYGVINTMLLLASSWFVASAMTAARRNVPLAARRFVAAAIMCGIGFAIIKFVEYGEKLSAGITLTTNDFFMFYYIFTGIHFFHLVIGLGALLSMATICKRASLNARDILFLECGASFWHMVDLLWIVLFPLIYLML